MTNIGVVTAPNAQAALEAVTVNNARPLDDAWIGPGRIGRRAACVIATERNLDENARRGYAKDIDRALAP